MPWGQGHPHRLHKSGWEIQRDAERILERDGHHCYIRGCTRRATVVDHVTPLAITGPAGDHDGNKASMCRPHHDAKTAAEAAHGRANRSRRRPPEPHPGAI